MMTFDIDGDRDGEIIDSGTEGTRVWVATRVQSVMTVRWDAFIDRMEAWCRSEFMKGGALVAAPTTIMKLRINEHGTWQAQLTPESHAIQLNNVKEALAAVLAHPQQGLPPPAARRPCRWAEVDLV